VKYIPSNHEAGGTLRLGRSRPRPHVRRMLAKYKVALPDAPKVIDYFTGVVGLDNIDGNDALGDCTAAAAIHIAVAVNAAAGDPVSLGASDAITFYSLSTGYNPDNPATDQGGDEVTVLSCWRDHGLDGKGSHAIAGFISVDPSNQAEIRSALWLFENLYFGVELPDAWLNPAPSGNGFTWDVGTPNPENGHAFPGLGATDVGVQIDTWGLIGTITYAAISELCSEANEGNLFCVLTPEIVNRAKAKSPAGFDWAALVADFDGLGGSVTEPVGAPTSDGLLPDAGPVMVPTSSK
jgi:hypothetical protein